jgi:hypothetical protein
MDDDLLKIQEDLDEARLLVIAAYMAADDLISRE